MKEKIISVVIVLLLFVAGLTLYLKKTPVSVSNNTNGTVVNKNGTSSVTAKNSIVTSKKSDSLGEYLTDANGMTLYVFADDGKLQSNCTFDCLKKWPVFIYDNKNLSSSTDMLSKRMNVMKRSDGTFQYAYGEMPVYYYAGDKKAGDTNGLGTSKWSLILIKN